MSYDEYFIHNSILTNIILLIIRNIQEIINKYKESGGKMYLLSKKCGEWNVWVRRCAIWQMKNGDERAWRSGDREDSLRPAAKENNIISVFLIVHSLYPIIKVPLPEISFRANKRIPQKYLKTSLKYVSKRSTSIKYNIRMIIKSKTRNSRSKWICKLNS